MAKLYKHFSEYTEEWPWAHFKPHEIACKHCGELVVHAPSLNALEALRKLWGKAIIITSAHRCIAHNKRVGGKAKSEHLGLAFDCACAADEQNKFVKLARQVGFKGIGTYPKRGFVHLDMGQVREWQG